MSDGSSPQPLPALAPGGAADSAPAPWALLAPAQRDDPQADTAQADTAQAEPAQVDTWSDPSLLPPPSAPPERARSSALPIVAQPRAVPRPASDYDVMRAMREAPEWVALAIEIMATCGLRRAECATLRVTDFAPVGQGWTVRVAGKGA